LWSSLPDLQKNNARAEKKWKVPNDPNDSMAPVVKKSTEKQKEVSYTAQKNREEYYKRIQHTSWGKEESIFTSKFWSACSNISLSC